MATSLTAPVVVKVEGLGILEDIKNQFFIAPKGIEKATQHALNHALNAVRAKGVRMAREKYTAKARVIRARIKIRRVSLLQWQNWHTSRGIQYPSQAAAKMERH